MSKSDKTGTERGFLRGLQTYGDRDFSIYMRRAFAKSMGYTVHAVDPAADEAAFPGVDGVFTSPSALPALKRAAPVFAVVATQGQWDEDALVAALAHEPDYLGVVASPKRFAEMKTSLAAKAPGAALARIKSPAGLDLGARLPEEIAVSILAEIVKEHRASGLPKAASTTDAGAAALSAKDPVCGMTVRVSEAQHRAQHQGRDFYFCCAGCRARFLAAPEKYLAVGTGP
jgi:xanthine dehydrogenase accessory factor